MTNAFVTPDERHGFTGHEEWDEVGLIHMNGRMYDPALGRFLSADPTIQMPDDMQNYNRYSYINNNPLSAVDYSGYGFFKSIGKIFKGVGKAITSVVKSVEKAVSSALKNDVMRTIASIATAIYLGPQSIHALFASDQVIANTVVSSVTSSLISSRGDLKAAIQGAVTGVAFYGVGGTFTGQFENTIAHAVVGCGAAVASGGSCKSGALAGGFSAAAANYNFIKSDWGVVGGTVASAVIGGTASVLGGGKFENGAMTGAFGYLFNYLAHDQNGNLVNIEDNPALSREGIAPVYPVEEAVLGGGVVFKGVQVVSRALTSMASALQLTVTNVTPVLVNAEGRGGIHAAERFFDSLPKSGEISMVRTRLGRVRTVNLEGGGTASIRPFSETNPGGATVQINVPGARAIKVRYD